MCIHRQQRGKLNMVYLKVSEPGKNVRVLTSRVLQVVLEASDGMVPGLLVLSYGLDGHHGRGDGRLSVKSRQRPRYLTQHFLSISVSFLGKMFENCLRRHRWRGPGPTTAPSKANGRLDIEREDRKQAQAQNLVARQLSGFAADIRTTRMSIRYIKRQTIDALPRHYLSPDPRTACRA